MNQDELTRLLADRPRQEWPEEFSAIAPLHHDVPEAVQVAITGEIANAVRESRRQRLYYRAAAAGGMVALGVTAWFVSQRNPARDVLAAQILGPSVVVEADGKRPQAGQPVASGSTLRIDGPGEVFLVPSKASVLHVQGPGRVRLETAVEGGRTVVRLVVERGSVAIRSENDAAIRVEWRDGMGSYTMKGTTAQLRTTPTESALHVLVGSFDVRPARNAESHGVSAGESLTLSGTVAVKKTMEAQRADSLRNLGKRMDSVARGAFSLAEGQTFSSDAEIRAYYGRLDRVSLKDGRTFFGFAHREGDHYRVHTIYGILRTPAAEVSGVTPVR